MKNLFSIVFVLLLTVFFSCRNSQQAASGQTFGEPISAEQKIQPINSMLEALEKEEDAVLETKIEGKVINVCQKKGCWMTIERPDGEEMMVRFKDYGFFMPLDLSGQSVIMQGIAKVDTTSVVMLRHYAEDAGKSPEEIEKITEAKIDVTFEADGVIIK